MKIITDHAKDCDVWRDRQAECTCGVDPMIVQHELRRRSDDRGGGFRRHIKENKAVSIAVAIMTVLAGVNITTVAQNMKYFGSLATEDYVGGMAASERRIASEELDVHTVQEDKRFATMERGIDRIRAFTEIVPQLRNLLTLRCMGTRGLDDVIGRLEDEYRGLTGETFVEQSCERLLAVH